jgi:hypothetical protein
MQPRIRSFQPSIRGLIGTRTPHIRGRTAPRRTTSKRCFAAGPDSERIRACLLSVQPTSCASAHDSDRWIAPPATAELFNNLLQDDPGTGRRSVLHLCGCSSAGRARPRHGRGHEFEARHPLHSGCAHALRCRATWCWRPGCARSWPGHVQRDTTSDGTLARGHSRSGFTALVAQQAEQPSCKRQAARSNRRRGHQTRRVRLAGRGHRAFNPGTRVRIPHEAPDHCRDSSDGRAAR